LTEARERRIPKASTAATQTSESPKKTPKESEDNDAKGVRREDSDGVSKKGVVMEVPPGS